MTRQNLLVFGAGFSARACANAASRHFDSVAGTTRSAAKAGELEVLGIKPLLFGGALSAQLEAAIHSASAVLVSVAPGETNDPVLAACRNTLAASESLSFICYLSTVGVYGNHDGAWVSEATPCKPVSARSIARVAAENAWIAFAAEKAVPLAIFRLSGIYGPGRNAFVNIANGTSRRLVKPGQVFNRIHRDDIAKAFVLAAAKRADGIFNISDDEPAPPQDVVAFAHQLAGVAAPPQVDFATAQLTPMARSFYAENKRVANARSKTGLAMNYDWPHYRQALTAMWQENSWR